MKKPRIDVNTMLGWFRTTPEGRRIQRAAELAERNEKQRIAARAELDAAEKRIAEELPALARKRREAEEQYERTVNEARRRVGAVRAAHIDLAESTSTQRAKAERALRVSCDSRVRDNGPVWHALMQARLHVLAHCSVSEFRTLLADEKRGGYPRGDHTGIAEQAVALADASEKVLDAIDAVAARVRELQLDVTTDVSVALSEIAAELPTTCPCTARLDFSAFHVPEEQSAPVFLAAM